MRGLLRAVALLRRPVVALSTLIIYSLTVPLALLDAWATLYQRVCFPIYGIACVPRRPHFALDRHRLPYLNLAEKLNCLYCGYATGVLSYVRDIAAPTEPSPGRLAGRAGPRSHGLQLALTPLQREP